MYELGRLCTPLGPFSCNDPRLAVALNAPSDRRDSLDSTARSLPFYSLSTPFFSLLPRIHGASLRSFHPLFIALPDFRFGMTLDGYFVVYFEFTNST